MYYIIYTIYIEHDTVATCKTQTVYIHDIPDHILSKWAPYLGTQFDSILQLIPAHRCAYTNKNIFSPNETTLQKETN